MLLSKNKSKKIFTIIIFTIISSLLGILSSFIPKFQDLQLLTMNSLFQSATPKNTDNLPIVIVGFDYEYFTSIGEWPIPEDHLIQLLDNIHQAGAKCIVTDLDFFQQANYSVTQNLVNAMARNGHIFLGGKLVLEPGHPVHSTHYVLSPDTNLSKVTDWGLCNLAEDHNGYLRNYYLFQEHQSDVLFSIALKIYMHHYQLNNDTDFLYTDGKLLLGGRDIPIMDNYSIPLSFLGPAASVPTYSFQKVTSMDSAVANQVILQQLIQNKTFKDKIVLVGITDTRFPFCRPTPFSKKPREKMPDIEIHATAINTLLAHDFYKYADKNLIAILAVILAFVSSFVSIKMRPWQATLFFALEFLIIHIAVKLVFSQWGVISSYFVPITTLIIVFLLMIMRYYLLKHVEKKKIRKVVERYVSPNIMNKMLNSNNLPNFSGERRDLTVLVSDLRHFTAFLQTHEAATIVSRLSEYLKEVEQIIYEHQGSLDKFVGDEIMAVFGAPFQVEDHAERACIAAVEMVEKLRFLQKKYSQERQPYFNIGIGINTGQSITGNISGSNMYDFTFIGEEISLGAHIEHANKTYSTTILMAENTYKHVQNKIWAREVDYIRFIGSQRAIRLYELRGVEALPEIEQELIIDRFSEGLTLYRSRHYAEALKTFRQVLRYFPSDGPSRLYTIRSLNALESEPATGWDGIHDLKII